MKGSVMTELFFKPRRLVYLLKVVLGFIILGLSRFGSHYWNKTSTAMTSKPRATYSDARSPILPNRQTVPVTLTIC